MTTADSQLGDRIHILIAEDSLTQAERLQHILQRKGYRVTSTANGRQALDAIRVHRPALVLSDIVMPEMDGYELCRQIKKDPGLRPVPVILVTTLADPADVICGLECGADSFIVKPYDEPYLLSRIQFAILNGRLPNHDEPHAGVEIHFNDKKHVISAGRQQILHLLLSTYEAAVQRNEELTLTKENLRIANASLEAINRELAHANEQLHMEVAERKHIQQRLVALNEDLAAATKAASAASQAKSSFLANMSHEIRTPMTAILGYSDLILDPASGEQERTAFVKTIRQNGEHLLNLINDILDLAKIEAGKLVAERTECNPSRIVSDVASLLRLQAVEKNLYLKIENDGPVPLTIRSDAARLRQILLNLVGNAIKFTRQGSIRIVLKLEEPAASSPRLRFDVIDTGIGMTSQQMGKLFQPFVQLDNSPAQKTEGTGLGLAISERLARMLGGHIAVNSVPGQGSTFSLSIDPGPLSGVPRVADFRQALEKDSPAAPTTSPKLRGRVLLVDDSNEIRHLLSEYLRHAGVDVTQAANGQMGIDLALAAAAEGKPFDVILMDMAMPELDGYAATTRLRDQGYTGAIIAITAHAMTEDRAKCLQAGCTDYLSKPFRRNDFLSTLARYLR